MRDFFRELKNFFRKGDLVLLILCLTTSAFGCLVIASVTNAVKFGSSTRYIIIQVAATLLGVFLYAIMSSVDAEFFSEHRVALVAFNVSLLLLLIPFGTDNHTGNRSWLDFSFLPFSIQPAEICKIFYILTMASVMASHQNRLSSIPSVLHMAFHLALIVGLNLIISRDMGVSLIFVFIFIGMAFAGGVKLFWFLLGGGALIVAFPFIWTKIFSDEQRNRIEYVFNPEKIDPQGLDEGWHTTQSLKSLTGGGLTGQGLFNGNRTQAGSLFAQHTDYVFSSIGEELGFVGCLLLILLLGAIIARCIWVGTRSPDYMRRLICFGAASAMIFQVVYNIGMCIGVLPVVGLTLPLISYGGSSIVTIYAMLGLVSGVHARPAPRSHERYIRPPR
ncbi:MAG: FtsW/RodA/SpoVE family cell cycle protein [Oscillospiraceae bacterium]|nr:FtsW/RodA/SpoVE family cell cycle protein [Oscillospiraceae bacterium]